MTARSTVRAALATVEAADIAASLAALPGLLLPELMTAFGADSVLWSELDETTGSLPSRVVGYPEPLDHEAAAALEQHAAGFPLTRHTRPGGDGRPVRRSDLQSMREFRNSGMYADVAQKIGVDQMLATAFRTGDGLHICVSLIRVGPDFTSEAVGLLTQLRPLLGRRVARLYANPADRLIAGGAHEDCLGCHRRPSRTPERDSDTGVRAHRRRPGRGDHRQSTSPSRGETGRDRRDAEDLRRRRGPGLPRSARRSETAGDVRDARRGAHNPATRGHG